MLILLTNFDIKGEIIYRVELPDMEQITLIYLENNDADYCKSCKKKIHDIACEFDQYYHTIAIEQTKQNELLCEKNR